MVAGNERLQAIRLTVAHEGIDLRGAALRARHAVAGLQFVQYAEEVDTRIGRLAECGDFPQTDSKCPHIRFDRKDVVIERFWGSPLGKGKGKL